MSGVVDYGPLEGHLIALIGLLKQLTWRWSYSIRSVSNHDQLSHIHFQSM